MIRTRLVRAVGPGLLLLVLVRPGAGQELTLVDALEAAVSSHPAMGAAAARVDGADAALAGARAQRLPSLVGSAGLTRFQEPMLVAPLHAFDPTNIPEFDQSLVRGELSARFTVYEGGARGARIRGASAGAEAARWSREATAAELIEGVTRAYLGVLTAREIQAASQRHLRSLESERDRAARHLEEGTAPRVEVLRAEAAALDAQAQATTAAAQVEVSERALARLMGVDAQAVLGRALQEIRFTGDTVSDASDHPIVESRRRSRDRARARLDQERAARLPRISASAAVLDFGTLSSDHVAEWQAGVQVSWPIFTGGARAASISRAEADLRAAEDELRLASLQIATEADAAEAAVTESDARAEALAAAVTQWEEVARIEALSVEEGAGVQSDLLRAEAGLFQARAGLARARHDALLARVSLARARGALDMTWMATALEAVR